jgi:hypothetical protein
VFAFRTYSFNHFVVFTWRGVSRHSLLPVLPAVSKPGRQPTQIEAPEAGENVFTPQGEHVTPPVPFENVPAGHALQEVENLFDATDPGGHF